MNKQFINLNGEFYPEDQPVIHISNRSFRYGDGFFESMRLLKGELMFADLHVERIQASMQILKLTSDIHIDSYFLRERVGELVRRNKTGLNARARLTFFRSGKGLHSPESNDISYSLELSRLNETAYTINSPGLIIDVFDEMPKPIHILSNIKTCNSLLPVMAGIFKNQHTLDEVLILNQHGFLCEGMSRNLFVVYKNKIYTPALSEGCVAGIMRKVIMHLAKENDIDVIEAQINPEILNEADEVFLTNVIYGVQWVMGFNNKRYFNRIAHFLANKLAQL